MLPIAIRLKKDTMSSDKKKILITGGTGFIGRNLVEHFARLENYEVVSTYLTRTPPPVKGVRFERCDLRDPLQVNEILKGCDILIQAAATTSGSKDIVNLPSLHVTDNAVMNSYLFRAAHELNVGRAIFFSCTVMYPTQMDRPLKETDFLQDQIYPNYFGVGWTKVYIEKICEFYSRLGRTKYTVVRHSNIYGPHDKYDLEKSHVFGATITKVMQAESEIKVWGTGEETRDFVHVADLMSFVETACAKQQSPFELVNVALGRSITVADLVRKVIESSKKDLKISFDVSKPTIPTRLEIDVTRAREIFGWAPRISLDEGIQKTIQWYRENIR